MIDGKHVIFDFFDFEQIFPDDIRSCHSYFKFHYSEECRQYPNAFPFSPVNFHDWKEYYRIRKEINYRADGLILNNQTPRNGAFERRTHVQKMLLSHYGSTNVSTKHYSQHEFFRLIDCALISVCVPGARNNMLDRGQAQYMFLGACTISPRIVTRLSWDEPLIPNEHYLMCKDDYSDLIEKIEWVKSNKESAIQIGENAKSLFTKTSTPEKQLEWISSKI